MPVSIALLTEVALTARDAARIVALHADQDCRFHVLVPEDTDRPVLAAVLDHLSLLELRKAVEALRHHEAQDAATAEQTMTTSVAQLQSVGAFAEGEIVSGDPVDALSALLARMPADEVVVVTRPHAVEDTFHTDWASTAREELGIPVLHVYAGSSWLG